MKTKEQAFQLHQEGLSYNEIGKKLGIGKTTAYDFVKEVKLIKGITTSTPVPNGSELALKGRSERIPNGNPEQKLKLKSLRDSVITKPPCTSPKIKEFTGDDLLKMRFSQLKFEGKFLELIGKPDKKFSAVIWGLPKGGKSNFAVRFADYLQEYFGKVVYVAAEEGESATLQQKFKDIDGSKVTIWETRNKDDIRTGLLENNYDFVFIDSINIAGIDSDFLSILKNENTNKSFIAIAQSTKAGNFKGDQSLTHNCDFVIEVIDGVAYPEGRYNPKSKIKIFDEPLYQKNNNKVIETDWDLLLKKIRTLKPMSLPLGNSNKIQSDVKRVVLKPLPKDFGMKKQDINLISKTSKIEPIEKKGNILGQLLLFGAGVLIVNAIVNSDDN